MTSSRTLLYDVIAFIRYVLWELMISDCLECIDTRRWKHGLMFTDGTTRDPSAVAAVRGIYLNRGEAVSLAVPRADVEGISDRIGNDIVTWINQGSAASFAKGVQILDAAANVLESSRVSPSALPLSGTVMLMTRIIILLFVLNIHIYIYIYIIYWGEGGQRIPPVYSRSRSRTLRCNLYGHALFRWLVIITKALYACSGIKGKRSKVHVLT